MATDEPVTDAEVAYRCPQCGGNCWGTYRATNGVEWGRCQGNANRGEVGDGVACGFVWKRSEDHLVFKPVAPVTDAEVEAAIEAVADAAESDSQRSYSNRVIALKNIIAQRVKQAGAAAEDLARAAKRYMEHGDAITRRRCEDALAAFRAAQGGGK